MIETSLSVCPVPTEQQPINEYQQLKDSACFRYAVLDRKPYLIVLAWIWSLSWLLCWPIAASSFPFMNDPARFFLSGAAGANLILLLVLLRSYLGWAYVCDRLSSATIAYEESGWYDGQWWTKPNEILMRDRLVASYQIQPMLHRLKLTFGILALMFCIIAMVWLLL